MVQARWRTAAAVTKPTDRPFWHADGPGPRATWVLPVPDGPRASCRRHASGMMTFSRRSIHSQRASSKTCILFRAGIALKLKLSRLLTAGNFAALIPLPGRALRSNGPRGGARSCAAHGRGRTPANHDWRRTPPGISNSIRRAPPCKELDMIQSLCCRLARQLAIFPQNGWQPQGFEAMVQQNSRGFGHADCPRIRDM